MFNLRIRILVCLASLLFLRGTSAFGIFQLGVQGGMSSAKATTTPSTTFSSRTGIAAGAFAKIDLMGGLSLQPELLYVQKGAKVNSSVSILGTAFSVEATYKFDYITVPVLLRYTFDLPVIKPFIFGGPFYSMKSSFKISAGGTDSNVTGIEDSDFGVDMGAGVEISMAVMSLYISGRYSLGLKDIDKSANSWKNNSIIVMGGIGFGF